MATTVTYKGETLTTANNQTRTLKTAGKYMEDDVVITDVSEGGSAIVVTEEVDATGGTNYIITAVDLSNDTVSPETLLAGYTAHNSSGQAITGTASGGGGSTINNQNKSVTPSESQQSVTADAGYTGLGTVTVGAISSTYVGSEIDRKSSTDLTASGATVTAPAGFYSSSASKSVATGSAGTPTASKGTVSNHSVSVTPSVTNTTGYITGGTKSGTAVTVSASELVSGTYTVSSSGTKDITNYASLSVPAGTEGTPTISKGTPSNGTVAISASVTNSAGYISGGTKNANSISVSASELVSGTLTLTSNGTSDVTTYKNVTVAVPIVTYYTGSSAPASSLGSNGDLYLKA